MQRSLAFVAKSQQHGECDDRYRKKVEWRKAEYSQHTQQKNDDQFDTVKILQASQDRIGSQWMDDNDVEV